MRRVRTARAARRYPSILRMLASGELNLVSVSLIQPLLTSQNHESLLRKAARRSTREVERLVAQLSPALAEPRDRIRQLPHAAGPARPPGPPGLSPAGAGAGPEMDLLGTALEGCGLQAGGSAGQAGAAGLPAEAEAAGLRAEETPAVPALSQEAAPPGPVRVVFTFSAGEEVRSWLEQARDLLRHRFPAGRMEDIIGEALRRLVEREVPSAGIGARREVSPGSRHIPKWVQDEVWRRDSGRCAFVAADGRRCAETAWLEFDHVRPFAMGGPSDDPANIRLLCWSHNRSERIRRFGK
ncbi:MAG: hypothetical protein PHU21_14790 [Elusimicrobia bacterium]|nr:hypothetical protein [Elusimicrobiota bacterium]